MAIGLLTVVRGRFFRIQKPILLLLPSLRVIIKMDLFGAYFGESLGVISKGLR